MGAALRFALRRTSARAVLAVGVGGLLFVVYRAVRPIGRVVYGVCSASPTGCSPPYRVFFIGSSPWDLGVATAAGVVAMIAAAALYRCVSTRRSSGTESHRDARVTPIA